VGLLSPFAADAHPFLVIQPGVSNAVAPGSLLTLGFQLFPGDTPVQSFHFDFTLSDSAGWQVVSLVPGSGTSTTYNPMIDATHLSFQGSFDSNPLAALSTFDVGTLGLRAATPGATLSMADSSSIQAFEAGVLENFDRQEFSNLIFTPVVATVVATPEPGPLVLLALGVAVLSARGRRPKE